MAFSLFGRRGSEADKQADKEPKREEERPLEQTAEQPAPEKRGFFDRMRQAVTRTRENFSEQIGSVLALTREVDETSLADLETVLLRADIGGPTVARGDREPAAARVAARDREAGTS